MGVFACCLGLAIGVSKIVLAQEAATAEQTAAKVEYFETHIRPLLVEHCYSCHSVEGGTAEGGLLLDSAAAMRRGGSRGDTLGAADAWESSLLWKAVSYADEELQMPPDGKLPDEQLALLKHWLVEGAHDPREESPDAVVPPDKNALAAEHWAYQPPRAASIEVDPADRWSRDPIDRLIYRRQKSAGLSPNGEADPETLFRRLYHDLLGLPAPREEIEAYLRDASPLRYEKAVDRLMDSPAFGERMARRWMDVVRYADNKGYVFQEDREYKFAYRYRDWLIDAFNSDMPYDEFVRLQIAADSLDTSPDRRHAPAMGMLTLGRRFLNNPHDIADDRIDVMTRGLMGLTVACARCHDHKYDPIAMADYYSLHSAMINSEEKKAEDETSLMLVDKEKIGPAVIFKRGNPRARGDEVEKRFVKFVSLSQEYKLEKGSGRTDVAAAITDPANPLTARTVVNRVWGWLLGKPLVATPSDLGLRCESPVQQDVLDQLAVDFVEGDWSMKRLVRRLVLSSTYRMSSDHCEPSAAADPTNELWWRAERKRLDFESLRDAMLSVSDRLEYAVGGPSIKIFEPSSRPRRTLYAYIDRQNLPGVFRAFDFANPDTHVARRSQTTVPQQGLFLLNSDFAMSTAERVAELCQANGSNGQASIRGVFERILRRSPSDAELAAAEAFLAKFESLPAPADTEVWLYGHGSLDRQAMKVLSFEKLPVYHDGRWAGGTALPAERFSYTNHSSDGVHPGRPGEMAAIRRWVAPRAGEVQVNGFIEHLSDQGDGVEFALVVGGERSEAREAVHHRRHELKTVAIQVEPGSTIDFIVDSRGGAGHDSCRAAWTVRYTDSGEAFASKQQFQGPSPPPIGGLAQLAQALMLTNEFAFID